MKRSLVLALSLFLVLTALLQPRALADTAVGTATSNPTGSPTPVEIVGLRTAHSRTYAVGGYYSTEVSAGDLNFKDASGTFQPIDNSLVPAAASGYANVNHANRYSVQFPSDIGSTPVHFSLGSNWVNFSLAGATGAGSVSGSTDTYALPSGSVSFTSENDALKEAITLNGPTSPSTYTYQVQASPGLSVAQNSQGGIDFTTASGKTVFSFAPPYMYDQAGATSQKVSLHLTPGANGSTVTISADPAWLADPSRQYPVVIDPTVSLSGSSDCYIVSGVNASTNYCGASPIKVGYDGANDYRSLLQFDLSSIPGNARILNADLSLYTADGGTTPAVPVSVYALTRSWTSGATWNSFDGTNAWTTPGGDFNPTAAASNSNARALTNGRAHWYPTSLVQSWVSGTTPNDGILFKEPTENVNHVIPFAGVHALDGGETPTLVVAYDAGAGSLPWYTFDSGVNVANGNLLTASTDLSMPGVGLPLSFGRALNSQFSTISGMGQNWLMATGQDVHLSFFGDGSIAFAGPSGYAVAFSANPDGSYATPPGLDSTLVKNTDGTYTLTAHADGSQMNFNGSGYLTSVVTQTGNTVSFTYTNEPQGEILTGIKDTLGHTATLGYTNYTGTLALTKITDPAGRTYQYGYNGSTLNLTSYTDPAGLVTQYGYDSSHRLTGVTDPNGNQTTVAYDGSNRVSSITAVTNPTLGTGPTTSFTYNSGNTVVTDPNGHQTTYTFDSLGRVTAVKDANGHTAQTAWNSDNHVTGVTLPSGAQTTYTYSGENLTGVQLANGATVSASYTDTSHPYYPTSVTDAQGNTSSITYNSNGTVASTGDGNGHSASFTYNSNGTVATSTDENGHTTTYGYTSLGLPQKETPPCPNGAAPPCASSPKPVGPFSYVYNSDNLQSSLTDGNGKKTTFSYDADGRMTSVK